MNYRSDERDKYGFLNISVFPSEMFGEPDPMGVAGDKFSDYTIRENVEMNGRKYRFAFRSPHRGTTAFWDKVRLADYFEGFDPSELKDFLSLDHEGRIRRVRFAGGREEEGGKIVGGICVVETLIRMDVAFDFGSGMEDELSPGRIECFEQEANMGIRSAIGVLHSFGVQPWVRLHEELEALEESLPLGHDYIVFHMNDGTLSPHEFSDYVRDWEADNIEGHRCFRREDGTVACVPYGSYERITVVRKGGMWSSQKPSTPARTTPA